jgi:hypothetical protein
MKDDRVTPLRIQYAAPSLTRENEVFGILTAGFSDEEYMAGDIVYPYPGTFMDQLKLPRNEHPFRFEQTDYDILYNECLGPPRHSFQLRFANANAIARGGRRVVEFVRGVGDGWYALSSETASQLLKSGLTGFELFPIRFDIEEYKMEFELPCEFFGLNFLGRAFRRVGQVVGLNQCVYCGQNDLYCFECGDYFLACPKCKAFVGIEVDDPALEFVTFSESCSDAYRSSGILDGDRYDGSDFFSGRTGQGLSARAVEWFLEHGVRGFCALPTLLAYR